VTTAPRRYVTAAREWQVRPLLRSMQRHCRPFVLHVLAWDWPAPWEGISRQGDGAWLDMVPREAFLARHPGLLPLPGEPRRPTDEVCSIRWTFLAEVMRVTGQPVTAIDGDLWFWASPEPVFEEIGAAKMAVSPHGFAPAAVGLPGVTLESHGQYGRYNGGWVYFADQAPAAALAELCRGWCRTGFLDWRGRRLFGDQGWLEVVAENFGAHAIRHPGLNVAPWNVHRYPLPGYDGPQDLIAFHYSSLRFDGHRVAQLANPEYAITDEQARRFYAPYVQELEAHAQPAR